MNNIDHFNMLTGAMGSIYEAKNHDYGNSFEKSCDEYGITAALVRIEDKLNRLKSLRDKDPKVTNESITEGTTPESTENPIETATTLMS